MMKIKTLVAVAAFALTGTAFAKIGSPAETADGGELSLHLFSQSGEATYQFDSGVLFKDFNLNALAATAANPYTWNATLDAATDTAFASFLAAAGSASDLSFAFFGGDNNGVQAAQRGLTTTVRAGGDASIITNGNIVDSNNQIQNYIAIVNGKQPSGVAANGSSFFTQAEGAGHYFVNDKPTFNTKFSIGNDGLVGTSLNVYSFVRSSTAPLGDANETLLGTLSVAKLNDTQYAVNFTTPVPEPTSVVLALVGLGALGAMSRRRAK